MRDGLPFVAFWLTVILIALVRWGARPYQPPPDPVEPIDIYDPLGLNKSPRRESR
jgi:hypothetical protein